MSEVLQSPSSSSPTSISTPTHNTAFFNQTQPFTGEEGISSRAVVGLEEEDDEDEEEESSMREKRENDRRDQLSLLALLVTIFRKGFWLACKTDRPFFSAGASSSGGAMEISWPTDVQHVNHVTFDRFAGFLGLPVEFEPEVSRRAPSASARVFGVSTESMQLSYDLRGNSIPTILLLMRRHLYSQGGLQAEGIFRIAADNSQEEFVREQLNRGVVPQGMDVHCLAGLIKAWFRELPRGVLDSLSPEQVMVCESEEECEALVVLLPPAEAALLDWAVNLMADVVLEEHVNKMNARNIAMVFAPNMTHMADPLTALMYSVQVINFLKTLIHRCLRQRRHSIEDPPPSTLPHTHPSDDNDNHCSHPHQKLNHDTTPHVYLAHDPSSDLESDTKLFINTTDDDCYLTYSTSTDDSDDTGTEAADKTIGKRIDYTGNLSHINSMNERCVAWR